MSDLVLKIAAPDTVTVPVTCELFGDNDKVISTLKLKVTLKKTGKKDWKRETEEADSSQEDSGQNIMLRKKVKNIEGLPLERDGQPAPFDESAMDLVLEHPWIADEIWMVLQSVNSGRKSDSFRRIVLKN